MLTDKSYQNKMNNDKNLFFSELRCELRIIYFLKLHPFLRHYCTKHVDPKPHYNCPVFYFGCIWLEDIVDVSGLLVKIYSLKSLNKFDES